MNGEIPSIFLSSLTKRILLHLEAFVLPSMVSNMSVQDTKGMTWELFYSLFVFNRKLLSRCWHIPEMKGNRKIG